VGFQSNSLLFSAGLPEAADQAQHLFERYGHGKAIVLARSFARCSTQWRVLGGLLWTVGLTVAGQVLGASIPTADRHLLPVIALEFLSARRARRRRCSTPGGP